MLITYHLLITVLSYLSYHLAAGFLATMVL
jgi:hypothetical protein